MSDRHNIRKGIAALLSILSVGSVASAARGPKGLSKSQNIKMSKGGNVPGNNGNKKHLSSGKNLNLNSKGPSAKNGIAPKKDVGNLTHVLSNENMGYSEHFKAGVSDLYGRFRELPGWKQALLSWGAAEGISVLTTHKGVVENVFNLTFNRFIGLAREKIFGIDGEDEALDKHESVADAYYVQDVVEDMVLSKLGPITGVFAKLSYYLKDSWVDPFVAFVKGLMGTKFGDLANDVGEAVNDNEFRNAGFSHFKGLIDNGYWGKAQAKAWWMSVSSGFKFNDTNMFFYELGLAIRGKKIINSQYQPSHEGGETEPMMEGQTPPPTTV